MSSGRNRAGTIVIDQFLGYFPTPDSVVYFFMGATGTLLFVVRLAMMLLFGGDDAGDFDMDADGDIVAHGGGFTLFSMLSILSFTMGAGWLGLACRMEWGLGPFVSALCAAGFGFALMLFSSFGMYQMRKLNEEGGYNLRHCIGHIGQVYLKVPQKGEGRGQVQITVDGRRKVLPAVSTGEQIESFVAVKVVEVQEQHVLIVERQ